LASLKDTMDQESNAIVAAIATLSDTLGRRVEAIEEDFVEHLRKVEDRLNVLVDLAKTVAVLQTQTAHFFEELGEVRTAVRENANRVDQSFQRVHARVDDVQVAMRASAEVTERDFQIALKSVSDSTAAKLDTLVANHNELSKKIDNWLSWGRGAYAVAGLLVMFIVWTGNRWLNDLETKVAEISTLKTQLSEAQNRINHLLDERHRELNGGVLSPPPSLRKDK
jgi:hypothetical protein